MISHDTQVFGVELSFFRVRVEAGGGATRPSANSGHNARNFCKNGVTTIFQVAIWTICELLVQPRKGFE